MIGSKHKWLQKIDKILLSAGHGAKDPGAGNAGKNEREQTIYLVDKVAQILSSNKINVDKTPYSLDSSVKWANIYYPKFYSAWSIELHRDSFLKIKEPSASWRCGCYYGLSLQSRNISIDIQKNLIKNGADKTSWSRSDIRSNGGIKGLEWIRKTKTLAHLIELGFMQGDKSEKHLDDLALICAKSIYEVFTGSLKGFTWVA